MEIFNKLINVILGLSMIVNSLFAFTQLSVGNILVAFGAGSVVFLAWVALHVRGKIEENPKSVGILGKIIVHSLTAITVLSLLVGFISLFV